MSLLKLGIDVSKKTIDVCLIRDPQEQKQKHRQFSNSPAGFSELNLWILKVTPQVHAVLEATGAYSDGVAEALYAAGHQVSIVNPARVKAFAQSRLQRNKTDRSDASLLAAFALQQNPPLWRPPAPEVRELQILVRHLDDLIEQRTQVRNRVSEGRLTPEVKASWQQVLLTLEHQIKTIKCQLTEHFDRYPPLCQQRDWLASIPGIGLETAARLLGEIPWLAEFHSARAAAAWTGLTPQRRESGTSLKGRGRLSKMGNARVRYALYFPAIAALRCNPEFKKLAERLTERGKTKMQIIGAAMHKLIRIAFGVLKHQTEYQPDYAKTA